MAWWKLICVGIKLYKFMKLSWSHRLFLRFNEQIGKHPRFDAFMKFVGERLIVLDGFAFVVFVLWATFRHISQLSLFSVVSLLFVSLFLSLLISYLLGFLWPHRRPIVELPSIKELIVPLSNWKSLPSDHTIISFLFGFLVFFMGFSGWGLFFMALAALIGAGRVYCGVHYPRDIVVGITIAGVVSFGSSWLHTTFWHYLIF